MRGPRGLCAADLNGDGLLDLASANAESENGTVFYQTSNGAFSLDPGLLGDASSTPAPKAIAAADLDDDGHVDLALCDANGSPALFYQPILPGPTPAQPEAKLELGLSDSFDASKRRILAADLNADGRLDLAQNVVGRGSLSVWFQPSGGFTEGELPDLFVGASASALRRQPYDLVAVDTNQDGLLDLASANFGSETVTIFQQHAVGVFSSDPDVVLRQNLVLDRPAALLAADLNGDGEPDLATGLHRRIFQPVEEGASDVIVIYFGGK